ncbi:MAG TPA: nitroreductase family deazaflavin-dependent oxidoreductase [Acidimicrobiales bacterium]
MSDFNANVITEFRENAGKVGGPFEGAPMLLLHTTGRHSGAERINPLVYWPEGETMVIFASKGGAPTHPDWYHNLMAQPDTTVEVGTDTIPVHARETEGDEYQDLWDRITAALPNFAEYQTRTTRRIPLVVLERRDG